MEEFISEKSKRDFEPLALAREPGAEEFDAEGEIVIGFGVADLIEIEIAAGDGVQIEGPVLSHEGVEEEFAAFRSRCRVTVSKPSVGGGDDGRVHNAAAPRHAVVDVLAGGLVFFKFFGFAEKAPGTEETAIA